MEDLRGPTSPPPTAPSPGSPGDPAQDRAVEEGHSVGLYGHRSQMSHQSSPRSSLPGGGAVERLGPKAWGGAGVLVVSCDRNQHPSCFTPHQASRWSRAPVPLTSLCKAGDGRGRHSSAEEAWTLRLLLGLGRMREPSLGKPRSTTQPRKVPGWTQPSTPTMAHLRD